MLVKSLINLSSSNSSEFAYPIAWEISLYSVNVLNLLVIPIFFLSNDGEDSITSFIGNKTHPLNISIFAGCRYQHNMFIIEGWILYLLAFLFHWHSFILEETHLFAEIENLILRQSKGIDELEWLSIHHLWPPTTLFDPSFEEDQLPRIFVA